MELSRFMPGKRVQAGHLRTDQKFRFLLYRSATGNLVGTVADRLVSINPSDGNCSTLLQGMVQPNGIAEDSSGNLFVADTGKGTIVKLTPGGKKEVIAEGLSSPIGLVYDPKTQSLFVSESTKHQVSVVRLRSAYRKEEQALSQTPQKAPVHPGSGARASQQKTRYTTQRSPGRVRDKERKRGMGIPGAKKIVQGWFPKQKDTLMMFPAQCRRLSAGSQSAAWRTISESSCFPSLTMKIQSLNEWGSGEVIFHLYGNFSAEQAYFLWEKGDRKGRCPPSNRISTAILLYQ